MTKRFMTAALAVLLLPGIVMAQKNKRDMSYYKNKYRTDNNIEVKQDSTKVKQEQSKAQKDKVKPAVNPIKPSTQPAKPVKQVEQLVSDDVEITEDIELADSLGLDSLPPQPQFVTVTEEVVIENPVTREIAITLVEKQVEVTDASAYALQSATRDEDEDDGDSAPVAQPVATNTSAGKYNPFKSSSARNNSAAPVSSAGGVKKDPFGRKKAQAQGGGTQGSVPNGAGDKLRMAYTASNLAASPSAPLYSFRRQPESPFAAELFEQNQSAPDLSMGGRWASTLRNQSTLREMLIVDVDATTKRVKVIDNSDMMRQQAANPQWKGCFTTQALDDKTLNLKYEYSFQAQDITEVGMFAARLLQPYCGTMVTTNPGQIKTLAALEDTPIQVSCTMSLKLKPAKMSLHGTMSVKCTATADGNTVQVLTLSMPCTMYSVDNYSGFESSDAKAIDYAKADTTFAPALLAKTSLNGADYNNLGYCYLNGYGVQKDLDKAMSCFLNAQQKGTLESYANLYLMYRNGWGCEKDFFRALACLDEGRKLKSIEALVLSADLMLEAPKGNPAEAYQWFSTAERAKNEYAILRLGHLTQAGEGVAKNVDAAVGYFNRSKDKDAYYEQAKQLIKEKKWSAVFNICKTGAQMGSQKCMMTLAEMVFSGIGVRKDLRSAKRWLTKIIETRNNELKGYRHVE